MDWADEWWKRISGPQRFIEAAAGELKENGVILLQIPPDLCWRYCFRAALEEKVRQWFGESDWLFEELDVSLECPGAVTEEKAGYAVLEKMNQNRAHRYRPANGTIAQFLSSDQEGFFTNRVLWVKGLTPETCKAFCELCCHCAKKKVWIILEDSTGVGRAKARLHLVDYLQFISDFDTSLLCLMAVNQCHSRLSDLWKQYIATLSANLCGVDPELAVELISRYSLRDADPRFALLELAEGDFSRRGQSEEHVLYHVRNDEDRGKTFVERQVWRAQLQVGLPVIEQAYAHVVKRLYGPLAGILADVEVIQYNQRVTSPSDLEVGTMVYLIASKKLTLNDTALKQRIHVMHQNRNRMAHVELCSLDDMDQVFALA